MFNEKSQVPDIKFSIWTRENTGCGGCFAFDRVHCSLRHKTQNTKQVLTTCLYPRHGKSRLVLLYRRGKCRRQCNRQTIRRHAWEILEKICHRVNLLIRTSKSRFWCVVLCAKRLDRGIYPTMKQIRHTVSHKVCALLNHDFHVLCCV